MIFPDHPEWSVQTARLLAQVAFGGADYFDVAATAARIVPRDPESWQSEWEQLGEKIESRAKAALNAGRASTAKWQYFQAGSYYRQSDFFLAGSDPRKRSLFEKTRRCFREAASLHEPPVETIQVTCGSDSYDGYFHAPRGGQSLPAVFMIGGADSLAEELFLLTAQGLAERGIALMLADTPGRGSTLRLGNIPTRPDYEVPVGACLDYLAGRPEVDAERMGLFGISLGGYYAPRAAAFDDRVKALVAWCGCYDVLEDLYAFYPPIQSQMQWILGADSDVEARRLLADFNLSGHAAKITCPLLISHAQGDALMDPGGARRLFEEASSTDKELKIWPPEEGGAVHCSWDSLSFTLPHMLDWLAERL